MKMAFLLISCLTLVAQEDLTEHTLKLKKGAGAAKAELSQFKFLQGEWSGTGFGAKCDEMWSAVSGDSMLGTFRMVKDGQVKFTEFCVIQKDTNGGVVLRLKHFDPNFNGWEAKDKFITFPLVKVEKKTAYFEGLTYSLQTDGSLKIWVAMMKQDGKREEAALHLRPVRKQK